MHLDRRTFLSAAVQVGLGSTLFPGVLYAMAAAPGAEVETAGAALKPVTPEMIDAAAALAGVSIEPGQRQMMLEALAGQRNGYAKVRALKMPNAVAPAYVFDPLPPGAAAEMSDGATHNESRYSTPAMQAAVSGDLEQLAFLPALHLAGLLRRRKISSVDLTSMYLRRLKRFDPLLHFVVNLTEERALTQAREADAEIARGRYRGPLHGLPWGAKDLLAVKGYPTTWGAGGYERQQFDEDATVVQRLDAAGAVLVAKLTLGALAMGDVWFGGKTRNPWNPRQGSSGSSAGPASATAAGCVAFSIGSETLGSISSPATRCGATGLRPTFGYVPRTGAMALSWTMDKLGPICRTVEDCAAVLAAIYGPDGKDLSARNAAFRWDSDADWRGLRVGYLESAFAPPKPETRSPEADAASTGAQSDAEKLAAKKKAEEDALQDLREQYDHAYNVAALAKLRAMGLSLQPVELPKLPYGAMVKLLTAEAAAAFDDLTMSGRDKLLTAQSPDDWPNSFRVSRFYPAVEYIQANRARSLAIAQLSQLFEGIDVLVAPSGGLQLLATNLTGHPAVIVPNGFRGADAPRGPKTETDEDDDFGGPGTPVSLTFLAGHYNDAKAMLLARAYQQATGFEKQHPPLLQPSRG